MTDARLHPDLFTPEEAMVYLRLDATDRTLDTLRAEHGLQFVKVGRQTLYHRRHLDALVNRLAGFTDREPRPMRIAGGKV